MATPAQPLVSWRKTLGVMALTFAALFIPDVAFYLGGYHVVSMWSAEAVITVLVLAVLLTLMPSWRARVALVAFITLGQLAWLGCLRYFGSVLRPDQLMLAVSEVNDTALGVAGDLGTLFPVFLIMTAVAVGLLYLHGPRLGQGIVRVRGAGFLVLFLLAGAATRWSFWKEAVVAFPGLNSATAIGTYHAGVAALRYALVPVKAGQGLERHVESYTVKPLGDEPVTVLFVMGESINFARLSLYGAKADTSPNLHAWRTSPPDGMELIGRVGFASGVATLGSVPSFIRTAFVPIGSERTGLNLFDLARQNGFKSWYFSAQSLRFLSTAGGAPGAVRIETYNNNEATIERIKDDFLVELVQSVPADAAPRQFMFIHQRVNHTPYEKNCTHVDEGINIFSSEGLSKLDARPRNYDNGLRCWDRNVAALVKAVGARPGAVHVFVTSDHNEFMGEEGLWGHLHPTLRNGAVPMILITNRPQSEVAKEFRAMAPASFYNLSRVVAEALGVEIAAPPNSDRMFYMNKTLPFGMTGYLHVEQTGPWRYSVRSVNRQGVESAPAALEFPEFGVAEAYAQGLPSVAATQSPGEAARPASGVQ